MLFWCCMGRGGLRSGVWGKAEAENYVKVKWSWNGGKPLSTLLALFANSHGTAAHGGTRNIFAIWKTKGYKRDDIVLLCVCVTLLNNVTFALSSHVLFLCNLIGFLAARIVYRCDMRMRLRHKLTFVPLLTIFVCCKPFTILQRRAAVCLTTTVCLKAIAQLFIIGKQLNAIFKRGKSLNWSGFEHESCFASGFPLKTACARLEGKLASIEVEII